MFKYTCLNPIADVGLNNLTDKYTKTDDFAEADAVLVRSAAMHDMELSDNLCAVARAGAGVNNIPLDKCADKGIVVFNTPGANANGVKELFVTGMLLAARDVVGGIEWAKENADNENISKDMEKAKKQFAGTELMGKKIGVIGLGAIGVLVANVANRMKMDVYGVDPFLSVNNALSLSRDVKIVKSYEEIYKNCDYITIHVPLLEDTKGMLNKEAFDKSGLIYGMGHAVYSISDPRAKVFKSFVEKLADEKKHHKDFELYSMIERLAPEVIAEKCRIYKGVSANVDFYSGFVYSLLGIPLELYTPIFAIARIVGWSAHRMEELINVDKIIRPAYKSIVTLKPYQTLKERSTPKLDAEDKKIYKIGMHEDGDN